MAKKSESAQKPSKAKASTQRSGEAVAAKPVAEPKPASSPAKPAPAAAAPVPAVAEPAPQPAITAAAPAAAKKSPAKKTAKPSAALAPEPVASDNGISSDDIALRAYFISEKRRNEGLPGDDQQDWLEAERQLKAERGQQQQQQQSAGGSAKKSRSKKGVAL